jgi:hypothetical protein
MVTQQKQHVKLSFIMLYMFHVKHMIKMVSENWLTWLDCAGIKAEFFLRVKRLSFKRKKNAGMWT